jgi:glycosyltransferase involved in cell wall biosynthesis
MRDMSWLFFFPHFFRLARCILLFRKKNPAPKVVCCMAKPGAFGGTELQFRLIAANLKEHNLTNAVLTAGRSHSNALGDLSIAHLPMGSTGTINYLNHPHLKNCLASLLRRLDGRVLQLFNPRSARIIPAAKQAGMGIVYMEMGLPAKDSNWWTPLVPFIHEIDYVVGISQASLNRFKELFDYKGPASVVPSLIDPFPANARARAPAPDLFRMIYFGRVCRGKGVDILLEAFEVLSKGYPQAELIIIGDGPLLKPLKRLAQNDQIHFLGRLERGELLDRLVDADVCCLPSLSEGLPCSLLEAMSLGLPLVATSVGGIPELIRDGENGLLVPPNNKEALANALLALASSPDLRQKMGEAGLKRYNLEFNREAAMEKLLSVYKWLNV